MNRRINIAVIGHLDHGKSTLIGRLLADTRSVPEAKIREAGANPAYLLDSFSEEREKNFTLDAAQAIVRTRNAEYNFIDCPGHKTLIKNMLSGTSAAESAILVISADHKEGIDKQTKTHCFLAGILGIRRILFVVTKMDAAGYERRRFYSLARDMRSYLQTINACKTGVFVPVSAVQDENIMRNSRRMRWYRGKPLFSVLKDLFSSHSLRQPKALRMIVQTVQSSKNGPAVCGRIEQGTLKVNERVFFIMARQEGIVKSIMTGSRRRNRAIQGECVSIIVSVPTAAVIERGEVMSGLTSMPAAADSIRAELFLFKRCNPEMPLKIRIGLRETNCKMIVSRKRGAGITAGLHLSEPLIIEPGSAIASLNKFVLCRRDGTAVGAGRITGI